MAALQPGVRTSDEGVAQAYIMSDEAARLHSDAVVIDGLNVSNWEDDRVFRGLSRGGVTAINATVSVVDNFRTTIGCIAEWQRRFDRLGDLILHVKSADDILAAKAQGRTGIIFGFQNTSPIEDDLYLLSIFHALGVRIIQLTYNDRNFVGDGCLERTDTGLSQFGLELIQEMNRLGILIDLSHVGYRTTMEAIEASTMPVAFTHAGPHALFAHPRNKTDEQLKALAKRGGMVGANSWPPVLAAGNNASLADFLDTIDYMVDLVGPDHVGLGLDFTEWRTEADLRKWMMAKSKQKWLMDVEFPTIYPDGLRGADEMGHITDGLLRRGHSEEAVTKIMGGNFLRLFREVWR